MAESTSVIETLPVAQDFSTTKEAAKQKRTITPVRVVKNEKKALKKAKAREKKAANDELDQVLAELSIQYGFMLFVPSSNLSYNLFQDTLHPKRYPKLALAVIH